MTAVIPEGLEPVGVWDCASRVWADQHMQERIDWAKAHMQRPGDTCYAEFYLVDAPFAVLHRVKRNENGRAYLDPFTGGVAMEQPAVQALTELPPAHLLGR